MRRPSTRLRRRWRSTTSKSADWWCARPIRPIDGPRLVSLTEAGRATVRKIDADRRPGAGHSGDARRRRTQVAAGDPREAVPAFVIARATAPSSPAPPSRRCARRSPTPRHPGVIPSRTTESDRVRSRRPTGAPVCPAARHPRRTATTAHRGRCCPPSCPASAPDRASSSPRCTAAPPNPASAHPE